MLLTRLKSTEKKRFFLLSLLLLLLPFSSLPFLPPFLSFFMMLSFCRVRIWPFGLLPHVFPAEAGPGSVGWLGYPFGMLTATLMSMFLGVAGGSDVLGDTEELSAGTETEELSPRFL